MSTMSTYLESLRGQSIAVIGMGVSNTPLIRTLLRAGLKVTVCDKSSRERAGGLRAGEPGSQAQTGTGLSGKDPQG